MSKGRGHVKHDATRRFAYIILATALFVVAALQVQVSSRTLQEPTALIGYFLFGLMIFLGLFNLRKKLSMIPLGKASVWFRMHVFGGILALGLYWLHTGNLWPNGAYEQVLALTFYLVSFTGMVGYILLNQYPSRLTQIGVEVIYERIPAEIAAIREEAEAIILQSTEETGSDTIARHYLETFHWFFARPRHFWSHAFGSRAGPHWVRHEVANLRRYLNEAELQHLERLTSIAYTKTRVDFQYAAQTIMKGWLLIHLPLSVAVMTLATWHFILVHVYAI